MQILDELSAGALVLDHDLIGIEPLGLGDDRALEIGVVETPTKDVDQEEIVPVYAPGRADGKVVQLGHLGGGVPALDPAQEPARQLAGTVEAQRFALDEIAAGYRSGRPRPQPDGRRRLVHKREMRNRKSIKA